MGDDLMGMLSQMSDPDEESNTDEKGLSDLLGGLMGGGAGGSGDLGSLLGGLMGGGATGSSAGGSADDMMGMLGGLMGGGASGGTSGGDAGDLMGMLGGLMGGGATESAGGSAADAGGLGGLLGGLMGGGSAGGLGGLLGGLMGGGGAPATFGGGGGGAMLPFADTLAEKLGISPQMANTLIMGAIGLLTASAAKKKQTGRSVGLADMTDADYIRSSGMASRLSDQMGISEDDAIVGLQQAMGLMATQAGAPAAKPKKAAAKKTTAKKATGETAATKPAKKTTRKSTKATPKKSSTSDTGSDFMDLLDDPR